MPAEGMVHALELVHRLLAPQGVLIDIHPTGLPPLVEFTLGETVYHLGELQETDDFIEYRQADEALTEAIGMGLFEQQRHETFIFMNHADHLKELKRYLKENWSDAVWPVQIDRRAARLRRQHQLKETQAILRETTQITRYLRLE